MASKHYSFKHGLSINYVADPNQFDIHFTNGTSDSAATWTITDYDAWYHVVGQYGTDNKAALYVNGDLKEVGQAIEGHSGDNSEPLRIGGGITNRYTEAYIDGVRVYSRSLETDEILYNYNNRYEAPFNSSGLVGYWMLNEASGDTISDSSGEGNDGARIGATWTADYDDKYHHVFGLAFQDGADTWVNATYNYQTGSRMLLQGFSIVRLPAAYVTESPPYVTVRYQINFKESCTPSPSVDVWLRSNNTEGDTAEWELIETGLFSIGRITIDVFLPDLSLLKQHWMTGDFIGLPFAILSLHLGQQLVGGILVFAFTYVLYDRTQSIPYCCILWIITGVFFEALIPMSFFNIGHFLLALGIGIPFLQLLRGR